MLTNEDFLKLSDKNWRINHLYKIVNKHSKLITFKQNSIQKIIASNTANRKIILKARQFGVTTDRVIDLFDYTIFNSNVTACILAHEDDAIKKIFRIVRRAYKYFPEPIKPQIDRGGGSKYEMYFPEINSLIYCDLESRGDTINKLHISEAAFMDYERFFSTLQAVPLGGDVTIESTANGLDNFFYDIWHEDDVYEKIFLPWFFYEDYKISSEEVIEITEEEKKFLSDVKFIYQKEISIDQLKFRRFKRKELKDKYIQEYPEDDLSCFIHSGRTVVDQTLFRSLSNNVVPVLEDRGGIHIFNERDPKKDYVIGADVSEGIGGDFSVASVFCIQDMEEVGFFRDQISPFLFAKKLKAICDFFSTGFRVPLLAVESNNHGHAVLLELVENIGYANLFYAAPDRPGWKTDSFTRPIMIDQLIEAVSNGKVKLNSKETLKEMSLLVEERRKIQAPSGKHDDCVIAAAIGVQMLLERSEKARLYENVAADIMI